jgi:hypothetical protein
MENKQGDWSSYKLADYENIVGVYGQFTDDSHIIGSLGLIIQRFK